MAHLRQLALDLINRDRAGSGLAPLVLGDNPAAQMHADDMLVKDYLGHWWLNGSKPYMVYSRTGGTSYVVETVAASGFTNRAWVANGCGGLQVHCRAPSPEEAITDHQWGDTNGDQGRRDIILRESHRAVNIGIAWNERRVVLVQHFEGGAAMALDPPLLIDKRYLSFSVRKAEPDIRIGGVVSVYYDPPPQSMSQARIESLDRYCTGGGATAECGAPVVRVLPTLEPGNFYANRARNEVVALEWQETADLFTFSANVGVLMQTPGVYTLVVWRDTGTDPLTEKLVELSVVVE